MNLTRIIAKSRASRSVEHGFTMIELVIGIVLVTLIAGGIGAAFITATRSTQSTSSRVKQSNDAQIIAAFLIRDAQAAGGTNPHTAMLDTGLGVSAPLTAPDCASASKTLIVRFDWRDWSGSSSSSHYVANYYFDSSTNQLSRRQCKDGTLVFDQTLGNAIASVVAACKTGAANPVACPSSPGLPDSVSLRITSTTTPPTPAFSYTLTASLRPTRQDPLNTGNAAAVPFLALGPGSCGGGPKASGLSISGSADFHVYGGVVLNASDQSGCPAFDVNGNGSTYTAAGQPLTGASLPDPYAGFPAPTNSCHAGTNPVPVGGVYQGSADDSGAVYPQALPAGAVLGPGLFVLCGGITGGFTATTGTIVYVAQGSINLNGNSTVTMTAPSSGDYAGVAVWQPASNTATITVNGGAKLNLNGTLYAPGAEVDLTGNADFAMKALIAKQVYVTGNHTITVGSPPATLPTISAPATLASGRASIAYPPTQITASGGSGVFTWTADLPGGLNIDSSGVISGTPATPVTAYNAQVTVTDNLGDVFTRAYTLTILPLPTINNGGASPSSRGQGAVSQNITVTGSDFDSGAQVSFSGSGITVNSTTPNSTTSLTANISIAAGAATGLRSVTVTNGDTSSVTKSNTFTVNPAPSVTSMDSVAQGVTKNLAVNGSGFATGAPLAVTVSGTGITVNSTTFANATTLNVSVTVAPTATTGTRNISVVNGDGGRTTANVLSINVQPTITSISPTLVTKGNSASVTITGTGFQSTAGVSIAPNTRVNLTQLTVVNSTTIILTIAANNNAGTGARTVTVTNPDGGTATVTFSINP